MCVCVYVVCVSFVCVVNINTHMKGFCLPILGPDLWFSDGCKVGSTHCQQSPTTVWTQKKKAGEEEEEMSSIGKTFSRANKSS